MAKRISIAITAGGGGTPTSYSVERNVDNAGWVVVNANIAYTGATTTFKDDNDGNGFADGAVVQHRATATNADGTSGYATVQSLTISSSGGGNQPPASKSIDTYTFDSQSADLTTVMTGNNTFISVMPNTTVNKMLFFSSSPESLIAMNLGSPRSINSNISASGSLQGISIPSTARKASMYSDGTSVIVGNSQGVFIQANITTAYNQSTASLGTSYNPSQITDTGSLHVDNATSRIYATEAGSANIFSFTMGDVLDVSTTSYDNKTVDLSTLNAGITNITGIRSNADMTKLYVMNADEKIYQLSFSTAGDITTLTDDNKFLDVSAQYNIMLDFWVDGTNVFALGNNKILYKYN